MLETPTRVVVTGAAGFIGSHLCERLLAAGHEVVGIDSLSDYYDRERKEQNLREAAANPNFTLEEADLVDANLTRAMRGAAVVFHLAGQPGVRPSWGSHFDRYVHDNIVATQRLLEALREAPVQRLVFASSSSVYGNAEMFPTKETALPRPVSPYGMTKLAAEHLTFVYMRNFGIPATSLRYFTVYGPRQRPDMAFCRFMESLVEEPRRRYLPAAPGDPRHTGASINLAREKLGWEPRVSLREGLARQWEWFLATPAKTETSRT